MTVGHVSL